MTEKKPAEELQEVEDIQEAEEIQETQEAEVVVCKVCGEEVGHVEEHANVAHGMSADEYNRFDPTPIPRAPIETSRRMVVISEPTLPEPTVKVRLARIPSNPYSCAVEARRGAVYQFTQKEPWKDIPAPDAHILLGGGGIPPKYPHLRFEKKTTRR